MSFPVLIGGHKAYHFFKYLNEFHGWSLEYYPEVRIQVGRKLYKLDAYDDKRRIIVEFDERFHQCKGYKVKDLQRQQELIEYLRPSAFFRYCEAEGRLVEVYRGFEIIEFDI